MASEPDVVVLPETWNTGFFPKERLSELAEQDCARVKRELGGLAAELGVNLVAGSVANVRGGKVYNTACVFDRAGNCVAEYDKTHLFTPMGEHAYFTPGDHLCRFRLDGHDCGLVICYDIRFPELTRTLAVQGMDMLFVVSQWPRGAHRTSAGADGRRGPLRIRRSSSAAIPAATRARHITAASPQSSTHGARRWRWPRKTNKF